MTRETPEFTAVVTCYYEEKSIREFHSRLSSALRATGRPYEIVMVNDGSTDGTFEVLRGLFEKDPNVTCVMDFFRNFGQAAAMTAGIEAARGRHFIFMDSDLQLDPEQLPMLLEEFDRGNDSVNGYRARRQDPVFRRLTSRIASSMLRMAAGKPVRDFGCTFRVVHGNLIRGFRYGPYKVFNQAEILSRAGRWKEVLVNHHARKYGKSGWTLSKLLEFYLDNLVNVSSRPFQALAVVIFLFACLGALRVLAGFWLDFRILPEVSPGLLLNAVAIGALFNLAVLALVGEFVIRGFRALQANPKYIVRTRLQK